MSMVARWLSDLPKKCDKDFHVKVAEKPESVRYILSGQHDFQKLFSPARRNSLSFLPQ
jgi:hypothetical protein